MKLETTVLQFPSTRRGESCTMKVKVYNGERNENKVRTLEYKINALFFPCSLKLFNHYRLSVSTTNIGYFLYSELTLQ